MSHADPVTRPSLLMRLRDRANQDAWSEFVGIYEPVIMRLAVRRRFQDADAREIVQEVLMRVASSIDRFDPSADGSFRGWLGQTTRRVAVDRFRALSAGPSRDEDVPQQLLGEIPCRHSTGAAISPFEQEFDLEHRRQLFRHAAALVKTLVNRSTWHAFWETAVRQRRAEDVAAELSMTAGAVYVAKCRVLKRIRGLVQSHSEH